jgi:hypothetical protein
MPEFCLGYVVTPNLNDLFESLDPGAIRRKVPSQFEWLADPLICEFPKQIEVRR